MSVYSRLIARLSILSILAFGLSLLTSTPVKAFDCAADCRTAQQECLNECFSWPFQPDEGCS
ncbi:MAG TPA: hypothetical protein VGQ61_17865, partial [Candidatus Angelobacter sp.]|nr:hypothetical protein [Candidatus Angelobacter sp.]